MNEFVYRIAHISDLHLAAAAGQVGYHDRRGFLPKLGLLLHGVAKGHIGELMSTYDRTSLRALSRALAGKTKYTDPYDGFVVTGDLATTGAPEDIKVAVRYFSGELIPGAADPSNPPYKFPNEKLAIFPGNHDRYAGRLCRATSASFEDGSHFGETWDLPALRHSETRSTVNVSIFRKTADALGLGIVGADFSMPSDHFPNPLLHLGRGRARQEVVDVLISETERLRQDGCAVVWATHFPPTPSSRTLTLARYQSVIDAAASARVNLILSGHTHTPESQFASARGQAFPGIRVLTAGTPCGAGIGERSYYELDLTVHGSLSAPGVRLDSYRKMIHFELPERPWESGRPGNAAEFVPAY